MTTVLATMATVKAGAVEMRRQGKNEKAARGGLFVCADKGI